MGKFFPSSPRPQTLPAPTVLTKTEKVKEGDDAARRIRLSEKRRQGRRASILTNISDEETQLSNISRPGADTLSKTFGG